MPIQVFGEGAIQTAYVSFLNIDLTERSMVLMWPNSYVNLPFTKDGINYNVLAASMIVTTGDDNTNTITLPDATKETVGSNFIITNLGASPFNLLKSDGATLISIPATALSNSYWVQLTANNTPSGIWQTIQFGAGTSSADASALAGNGLATLGLPAKLNTNTPVQTKDEPYTVTTNDRANLIVWIGGEGIITLPLIADAAAGFFVSFNNGGSGALTINRNGANIDGATANLTVIQGRSLSLISDGTNWWSLGFGPTLQIPLPINLGGTGAITREAAINALMPTTPTKFLAYFDGTDWVPTQGTATDGHSLKLVSGVPTWSA